MLTKHQIGILKIIGYTESVTKPKLLHKYKNGVDYYIDFRYLLYSGNCPRFYFFQSSFEHSNEFIDTWEKAHEITNEILKIKTLGFKDIIDTSCTKFNTIMPEGNGYCIYCNKLLHKKGMYCDYNCEYNYYIKIGNYIKCDVCNNYVFDNKWIKHHTSYDPEKIIEICRSCHTKIHHGNEYNNIKPNKDDINKFYQQKVVKQKCSVCGENCNAKPYEDQPYFCSKCKTKIAKSHAKYDYAFIHEQEKNIDWSESPKIVTKKPYNITSKIKHSKR